MTDENQKERLLIEAYKDLVRPTARQIGDTLGEVVRVALSPAKFIVWTFDQAAAYATDRVERILEDRRVPRERIISPRLEIAGPVISALRLAEQDESLRELYLNLLATAMDERTADAAHPAFAEIIRQLTPDEARVVRLFTGIKAIGTPTYFPLVEVVAVLPDNAGFERALSNFTTFGSMAGCGTELPASSIDNLERLGLGYVNRTHKMLDEAAYEALDTHCHVTEAIELAKSRPRTGARINYFIFQVTEFGNRFAQACTGEISCEGVDGVSSSGPA